MQGTIPTQALMPNVHQEVEKKMCFIPRLGDMVESGYCYLNAQRSFQEPAIWEQGCPNGKKAEG